MSEFSYKIRPIHPEKDAAQTAALIKACFRPWLDLENINYLDRLREAGLEAQLHPFWTNLSGFPYNLEGVVCADQYAKILGVINSYYFHLNGKRCCLIANVCVDPTHRKEGIASRMLAEMERIQKSKDISDIYLQARMESPEPLEFYRKRGFAATDYRETWIHPQPVSSGEAIKGNLRVERVPDSDMNLFHQRLNERYPTTVLWNLDYNSALFQPGLWGEIMNRSVSSVNRFRRIKDSSGTVKGWAAFQKTNGFADGLWLIPNQNISDDEILRILEILVNVYPGSKPLKLDVPTGERPHSIYQNAGFSLQHSLVWLWKRL